MKKKRIRKPFLQSVVYLQAHIRGYLVRKKIKNKKFYKKHSNGKKAESNPRSETHNKAASVIQKRWRQYMAIKNREKSLENLQIAHFCQQVCSLKNIFLQKLSSSYINRWPC
jgi:hypothetical protein